MADTTTTRKGAAAEGDGVAGAVGGGENLDKVRDILFGSQMRDTDKRFARIEERVAKELADLRDESRKRLDALETFIKREVQSLLDRIKKEEGQRIDGVKSLGQELKEAVKAADAKSAEIEDHVTQVQRELREEVLDQSKSLRDEIYQSQQGGTQALDRATAELRSEKADRSALAELFTQMAVRLSGENGDDE